MSTIEDFNRIEDCDKIDAKCVDAYVEIKQDEDNPSIVKVESSWGDSEVDLSQSVSLEETLTHMYLSPDTNPNCLVYQPERGDNDCISGDDLSRIISMKKLKDVYQGTAPSDGIVYMYDGTASLFKPYDLKTFISQSGGASSELQARMTALEQSMATLTNQISSLSSRISALETTLAKPTGAPSGATVAWGTINLYSDPNAVIDSNGNVTSLDKTHGLYTHNLNNTSFGDEIMG